MKRTMLPKDIQDLLRRCQYATLATVCEDGQPWATPLFVALDDDLTMYWASWTGNRHSKNIRRDPRAFVTIFETNAPEGAGFGLYMQVVASEVSDTQELHKARAVYSTQFGEDGTHQPFKGRCERRIYKAVPQIIWRNTDGTSKGQFVDKRKLVTIKRPA